MKMTVTLEGDGLVEAAKMYIEKLMPGRVATDAKLILSRCAVEVSVEKDTDVPITTGAGA